MWIYVVISFTRYNKVGRDAQKKFEKALLKDGFHHLHSNLFLRYCSTSSNANVHKERIKMIIPQHLCDISIIFSSDSQEENVYHSLTRKRTRILQYNKPTNVEFF